MLITSISSSTFFYPSETLMGEEKTMLLTNAIKNIQSDFLSALSDIYLVLKYEIEVISILR